MYQYSLDGVWTAPHFEKLTVINGAALDAFSHCIARVPTLARECERAGRDIVRWLTTTMQAPDGVFFANQDADAPTMNGTAWHALDAPGRRANGEPRVDTHVYASHNGRV